MILTACLLAAAVGLVCSRAPSARRLRVVLPPPAAPALAKQAGPQLVPYLLGGVAAFWLVSGVPGMVVGLALILVGPRIARRLDRTDADADELAARLPLSLDLLGACLAGGGVLHDAVASVAAASPGVCGQRLGRVAAALMVGAPPEEAFKALGRGRGPAGSAARALSRAAEGGTPAATAVSRVAEEARRAASVAALKKAKQAGVKAVGPLGACFLPAFVLLGIIPIIAGLAGPLLKTL